MLFCMLHSVCMWASTPVGQWEAFLSYQNTSQLMLTPQKTYAIANQHLYAAHRDAKELQYYSKIDGLSENNVMAMGYSAANDMLILVYTNANIDLVNSDGSIYNIPDLLQKNWSVDKTVYQIYVEQDMAYLACGFGIMVVDLTKREIKDTYIIGKDAQKEPIYGVTANETHFYALSSSVIYKADRTQNLLDYAVWQKEPIALPKGTACQNLYILNNQLFTIDSKQSVLQYKENAWHTFFQGDENTVSWNQNSNGVFVTGGSKGIWHYSHQLELIAHYNYYALDACSDDSNQLWFAAGGSGIACHTANKPLEVLTPSSIPHATIKELQVQNSILTIAPGGYWTNRYNNPCQVPMFQDDQWVNHTNFSMQTTQFVDVVNDVTSVAINPQNTNHFYFTTWGEGLFEVVDGKVIRQYNESNSNGLFVSAIKGNDHYVRLDGLRYDDKGNLWVLNSYSGIRVLDTQDTWHSLNYGPLSACPALRKLLFTKKLNWCVCLRSTPGIFVFSTNNTLDNLSDDKYRFFGSTDLVDKDGKTLILNSIYDVAECTDGSIWVGTDIGPVVFTNLNNIFASNYRCTRIKIPRNDGTNLADYLLDGVAVQAIEVDKGNRKWVGTASSGAFLLSPDGKTTLLHFTTQNSPLSSNEIVDISIDHQTGVVYLGTPEGLFAYRGDAMQPVKQASKETIYAFPNPVRPEYDGLITVAGLEENATVWITDASANVVFQGQANGGSISWNGRNASQQRVAGGVYFVLVSNGDSNNHRSVATKILIVR